MARDLEAEKRRLRREIGARRRALPAPQVRAAAEACVRQLLAAPGLERARRVALYAALPDEIPTRELFGALSARGLALLMPRVEGHGGLGFARVAAWEELRPGRFGVAEPAAEARAWRLGPGDWVVVPGVAFDRQGWRLGRGHGYYDRALAAAPGVVAVGMAHAFQIVARVPHDSHDRPVDAIVTEEGWARALAP